MPHEFCVIILEQTGATDIQATIEKLLAPYQIIDVANNIDPSKRWYTWEIGGRWSGVIHNAWQPDDPRLFGLPAADPLAANVLPVRYLDHPLRCYAIVTPTGEWFDADMYEKKQWENKIIALCQQFRQGLLVGVDCVILNYGLDNRSRGDLFV
jgi:hypothetical protein